MISHVTLGIDDIDAAMGFYRQFLEPLGWEEKFATRRTPPGPWAGFKPVGAARPLLIIAHPDCPNASVRSGAGPMVAFEVATRSEVDAAHALALALGGDSLGPPAPDYPATDYTACIRDPFGNSLCVVCHEAG